MSNDDRSRQSSFSRREPVKAAALREIVRLLRDGQARWVESRPLQMQSQTPRRLGPTGASRNLITVEDRSVRFDAAAVTPTFGTIFTTSVGQILAQ